MRRHLVIPDLQHRAGRSLKHLYALKNFIREVRPEVLIQLGDLGDYPSVGKYGNGTLYAEGRRLSKDNNAFCEAADILTPGYSCELYFLEGNHEFRVAKYMAEHPELEGSLKDPKAIMASLGWKVTPYLEILKLDGISYCHLFPKNLNGRVVSDKWGASSAINQIKANMVSCTAGHRPGLSYDTMEGPNGVLHGLIAGSYYLHEESYFTPHFKKYWRGVIMKHNVKNGEYSPHFIRIKDIMEKYG